MQELWQSILDLLSKVVTPDWGELIALIPLALLALVLLFFVLTFRAYAGAGPTRRAPARLTPIAPPDLHMPGPSYAPIFAAVGVSGLLWGLVVGGTALWIGLTILVLALLYWGREAIQDYDHATHVETLPAVVHAGPPPGIHMPGPSFRPLLGALGVTSLLGGLVAGGWLLAVGVIILVMTLAGWLVDAKAEYVKTVEADRTGHLENIAAPVWPRRLLQIAVALIVLAVLVDTGIFPPRSSDSEAGGGTASPVPSGAVATPGTAFEITAKAIAFDTLDLTVPANTPFTIKLTNEDPPGVLHDVDIRAGDKTSVVQDQDVINGGDSVTYSYQGLPSGSYVFICSIHPIPGMTGTLTVK